MPFINYSLLDFKICQVKTTSPCNCHFPTLSCAALPFKNIFSHLLRLSVLNEEEEFSKDQKQNCPFLPFKKPLKTIPNLLNKKRKEENG